MKSFVPWEVQLMSLISIQFHPSFSYEFNKTANHLSKCVIVMNERCEDSNKIIAHFLPWLGKVDICKTWEKKGKAGPNATNLVVNASQAILENNQMDELLFEFGVSLFEHQLKVARGQFNGKNRAKAGNG